MDALVRFNIAACAMQRAKIAVSQDDWPRNAREMKSWRVWMEHRTVTIERASWLASRANYDGWMEGFHAAERIMLEPVSTNTYAEIH